MTTNKFSTTMTASLPNFTDYEAFRPFRADPAQWLPVAIDIARGHGFACTEPQIFSTGTNLVVGLDEPLILKIFLHFFVANSYRSALHWRSFTAGLLCRSLRSPSKVNATNGRIS